MWLLSKNYGGITPKSHYTPRVQAAPTGTQTLSSDDPLLLSAVIFIYTGVSGRFRNFGHSLQLQCKSFKLLYRHPQPEKNETEPQLLEAQFDPNSIEVVAQTHNDAPKTVLPAEKQTFGEKERSMIKDRVMGQYVLNSKEFPTIKFVIEEQTAEEVNGILHMHGGKGMIKCKRTDTETHWVAECPLLHSTFGMSPYGIGTSWFSVAPRIDVEVRIPKSAFQ